MLHLLRMIGSVKKWQAAMKEQKVQWDSMSPEENIDWYPLTWPTLSGVYWSWGYLIKWLQLSVHSRMSHVPAVLRIAGWRLRLQATSCSRAIYTQRVEQMVQLVLCKGILLGCQSSTLMPSQVRLVVNQPGMLYCLAMLTRRWQMVSADTSKYFHARHDQRFQDCVYRPLGLLSMQKHSHYIES